MISIRIDEEEYAEISKGLISSVLRGLIRQLVDRDLLDTSKPLAEETLDLVWAIAFDVFSRFEDFSGHTLGQNTHPAVVGFMTAPVDEPRAPTAREEILLSPNRTHLHGRVDDYLIREAFHAITLEHAKSNSTD